jgi:ketosteroid isomerase-like protein
LNFLRSSEFKPASLDQRDLQVAIHGDTAIVTGVSHVKAEYQGKDMSGRYRFTQVYRAPGEEPA